MKRGGKNTETATGPLTPGRAKILHAPLSGSRNYGLFLSIRKKKAIPYTCFFFNFRHLFYISQPCVEKITCTFQRHVYTIHFVFFNEEMRFRSLKTLELEVQTHLTYDVFLPKSYIL